MAYMPPEAPQAPQSQPAPEDQSSEPIVCVYDNGDGSYRVEVGADGQKQSVQVKDAGSVLRIVQAALGQSSDQQYSEGFKQAAAQPVQK